MKVLLLILLTLSLKSQPFKKFDDKAAHFYVSMFGAIGIAEVTYQITDRPILSAFVGQLVMFGIGYGKEKFVDKTPSSPDLFPDGFGSTTGAICWGVHFDIKDRGYNKRQNIKLNNSKLILE